MFGFDIKIIAAAFAAVIAFVISWFTRGQKLKERKQLDKAEVVKDEKISKIRKSTPKSFHIDRVLGELEKSTDKDSDS